MPILPLYVLVFSAFILFMPTAAAASSSEPQGVSLATAAKHVFETRCFICHGAGGSKNGGIDYITDLTELVAKHKVVPGDPDHSKVVKRLRSKSAPMPPFEDDNGKTIARLRPEETEAIIEWITAGAPGAQIASPTVNALSDIDVDHEILADLRNRGDRAPYSRYFTLNNLYNSGVSEEKLDAYRDALGKLLNSLSWKNAIVKPAAIDSRKLIYRIDLQDYGWSLSTWTEVLAENPFLIVQKENTHGIIEKIQTDFLKSAYTRFPLVRADWFIAHASQPPLYHTLLEIPENESVLLERLEAKSETAHRAAFNRSGVSLRNRVIEREEEKYGAYWKSYDFKSSDTDPDSKNVLKRPLGPKPDDVAFDNVFFSHDVGEIIFHLPNGLYGYMLNDKHGVRNNVAPTEVVFDPKEPDGIINGVSCMSCHSDGLLQKDDVISRLASSPFSDFSTTVLEKINKLYGDQAGLGEAMKDDTDRYRQALRQSAVLPAQGAVTIYSATRQYEDEPIHEAQMAGLLGMSIEELELRLEGGSTGNTSDLLNRLKHDGIPRNEIEKSFGRIVSSLQLGEILHVRPSGILPQAGILKWKLASAKPVFWEQARNACRGLNQGSDSGWRMPTTTELTAFVGTLPFEGRFWSQETSLETAIGYPGQPDLDRNGNVYEKAIQAMSVDLQTGEQEKVYLCRKDYSSERRWTALCLIWQGERPSYEDDLGEHLEDYSIHEQLTAQTGKNGDYYDYGAKALCVR